MINVLDSYALLAYLEKDVDYEIVENVLQKAANGKLSLLLTTVNWGEVYYIVLREYGKDKADQIEDLLQSFPIEIIPVDKGLAREAAKIKAVTSIAYADCFAAALSKAKKAKLITGDPEFKKLEKDISIVWLR